MLSRPEYIGPGWMPKDEFLRLTLDDVDLIKNQLNLVLNELKRQKEESGNQVNQ